MPGSPALFGAATLALPSPRLGLAARSPNYLLLEGGMMTIEGVDIGPYHECFDDAFLRRALPFLTSVGLNQPAVEAHYIIEGNIVWGNVHQPIDLMSMTLFLM
jgi:hypothetical protein